MSNKDENATKAEEEPIADIDKEKKKKKDKKKKNKDEAKDEE